MKRLIVVLALLVFSGVAFSATYYVPSDFPTIQGGISSALVVPGDTIVVKPGVYVENIDFLGKDITVKSLEGPKATVIDGNSAGSVAIFRNGETANAVLKGFTIRNGTGTPNTSGYNYGGGVLCLKTSPTIVGNIFRDNHVQGTNQDEGGAIQVEYYSNPMILSNLFFKNSASMFGGCISIHDHCAPVLVNNVLYGNKAQAAGGGISCRNISKMIITNNTITQNWTNNQGRGGGLYISDGSKTLITNTIFWNNDALVGQEIYIGSMANPSSVEISYSDVKGGPAMYVHVEPGCTFTWGIAMIAADPLFVTIGVECHLTWMSPCRDVGSSTAPSLPLTDMEGDPRNYYQGVDMGADEFHKHLYYVGDAYAGANATLVFVDLPGSAPVGLVLSFVGFFDPPIPTVWGPWYPMFPIIGPIAFPPIPANGVLTVTGMIPAVPPGPYSIYMQAGINMVLTNPCILYVN